MIIPSVSQLLSHVKKFQGKIAVYDNSSDTNGKPDYGYTYGSSPRKLNSSVNYPVNFYFRAGVNDVRKYFLYSLLHCKVTFLLL